MATYSEIQITFNENLIEDNYVSFYMGTSPNGVTLLETFKNNRTASYQTRIANPSGTVGESSAISFVKFFTIDYNGSKKLEVTRISNIVTIKAKSTGIDFSAGTSDANVTFAYNNYAGTIFSINSIGFENATNPNTHVKLKVDTTDIASSIQQPISTLNTGNPYYLEVLRNSTKAEKYLTFEATNVDLQKVLETIVLPNTLSSSNIFVTVNNSPNGATVIINSQFTYGLTLEYSLDNSTWQTSNIFTGQADGDYTIYIKDNYGATTTKTFQVLNFGVDEPFDYVSKSNSLRLVKRSVNGIETDKQIDENRLSCEDYTAIVHKQFYCFESDHLDTTQIKTNYANISAKGIKEDGTEIDFTITKESNNIGLKDSRQAIKYNLLNGQTGIYFNTGKTYDFDTGIESGEYALNGNLPEWGKVGEFIKIDTAWFEIVNVITDTNKQAEVLVIENTYTGIDAVVKVGSIYNRENFDVYEFVIDMSLFTDTYFDVKLTLEDDNFETVIYESETNFVKEKHDGYDKINYSNDTNTDINYSTGIEHLIMVQTLNFNDTPSGEIENHKTDTKTILLSGSAFEEKELFLERMTRGMMIKVFRSFFHRNFYFKNTKYILSDVPEIELIGETNMYKLTARLIKANEVFNSKTFNKDILVNGGLVELPALISIDNGGYIKI